MKLNEEQIERYMHHIVLKDIGGEGQKKLLNSRVLIIGAGGLGSPAALYLAAAGIGTLGLADNDNVDLSNLQRQVIYSTKDIGRKKVECAKEKLLGANPDITIHAHDVRIADENIRPIISEYDFILDGSDNFPTKYLINDACVANGKPYSYGGVTGFKGQTFTYVPKSACLRCIFPEPPPEDCVLDCRGAGILGAAAGMIGAIQAAEAIKYVLNKGALLVNRLLRINALTMEFTTVAFEKSKSCSLEGGRT